MYGLIQHQKDIGVNRIHTEFTHSEGHNTMGVELWDWEKRKGTRRSWVYLLDFIHAENLPWKEVDTDHIGTMSQDVKNTRKKVGIIQQLYG